MRLLSAPSAAPRLQLGSPMGTDDKTKKDGTLGSKATMTEQPTHPDRSTGTGALGDQPTGEPPKKTHGTDPVARPNRDDVHEQRSEEQAREGTVEKPLHPRTGPNR